MMGTFLMVRIQVTQLIMETVNGLMDDGILFSGQNPGNTKLVKENVDGLMDDGILYKVQNPGNTVSKRKYGWIDGWIDDGILL